MSKRKNQERAESGLLFRGGRLVTGAPVDRIKKLNADRLRARQLHREYDGLMIVGEKVIAYKMDKETGLPVKVVEVLDDLQVAETAYSREVMRRAQAEGMP